MIAAWTRGRDSETEDVQVICENAPKTTRQDDADADIEEPGS